MAECPQPAHSLPTVCARTEAASSFTAAYRSLGTLRSRAPPGTSQGLSDAASTIKQPERQTWQTKERSARHSGDDNGLALAVTALTTRDATVQVLSELGDSRISMRSANTEPKKVCSHVQGQLCPRDLCAHEAALDLTLSSAWVSWLSARSCRAASRTTCQWRTATCARASLSDGSSCSGQGSAQELAADCC